MGAVYFHPGETALRRKLPKIPWIGLVAVLALILFASRVEADLAGDANGLAVFKNSVDHGNILQWNVPGNVCQWQGVQCSASTLRVTSIRLPGLSLIGAIPSGSIGKLTELRVLSLRLNGLSGSLPADLANCTFMRSIYLQNNKVSGPLPSDFSHWPNLVHVDLSFNNFSGGMSPSLTNLTKLKSLFLQNNSLSGHIPALNITSLNNFSVAYNQLSGAIPNTPTYQKFSQADFAGNNLCGLPLLTACPAEAPGAPGLAPSLAPLSLNKHHRKLSGGAIAGIVIGVLAFLIILAVVCFLVCCGGRRRKATAVKDPRGVEARSAGPSAPEAAKAEYAAGAPSAAAAEPERNGLVFFEGSRYPFDLEDLLRASAEVLGKGSVGTAYKAALENGSAVAVKRLKDVNIERREFERQIANVGMLKHENLVPLLAYYYSKEEKLLVNQFMTNGSLSSLLHGNKGAGRTPLDWDTRVRIALGAARGLDYLHDNRSTHGNIKSSNILLTNNYNGCVSDYGLAQLVSSTPAAKRIVGYRAPEVTDIKRVTEKADVYSFGVLLLELLTGKAPSQASLSDDGIDLPRWVQSVVREEWTAEVFDMELMRYQDIEEEMVQTLQIAMACVAPSPDQRPTMKQVVKMVQDLKKHSGEEATHLPSYSNGKEEEVGFGTEADQTLP